MQFSGETLAAVTHQSQLEAITTIMQSLNNPKEPIKKLRHSLKNLCFYKPSANFLGSLVNIMKREIEEPTHCFKLVCYHLIANSSLASSSPQVPALVDKMAAYLTGKKIGEHAFMVYRVFFHLCANLPLSQSTLIDTTAAILSIPTKEITKVSKKGIFSKETTSPYEPLVHEVCALLVDLPDFENNAPKLLTPEIIDRLVDINKILPKQSKEHLMHFLGRLSETPEALRGILEEKTLSSTLFDLQFIAKNSETYKDFIKNTLESGKGDMCTFKYILCKEGYKDETLIDSLLFKIRATPDFLLPILEMKVRYPETDINSVLPHIFVATRDENPTIAFIAFNILLFTDIENEWATTTFRTIFSKFEPEMRQSSIKRLYTTWKALVTNAEVFNKVVSPILSLVLHEFADAIEAESFKGFIQFLVDKDLSDSFLEMECSILDKLPATDCVIYIFYGASLVASKATPSAFASFKDKVSSFLLGADQSLQTIYKTLIKQ